MFYLTGGWFQILDHPEFKYGDVDMASESQDQEIMISGHHFGLREITLVAEVATEVALLEVSVSAESHFPFCLQSNYIEELFLIKGGQKAKRSLMKIHVVM